MVRLADYLQTAYDAVKGSFDKTFLDRPLSVDNRINTYAVVTCPNYVANRELDSSGGFDYHISTVNIDIYVRDKQTSSATSQRDILLLDTKIKSVFEKFPIVNHNKKVMIYRPRVILSSSDGDGWHYALISARLTTLIN